MHLCCEPVSHLACMPFFNVSTPSDLVRLMSWRVHGQEATSVVEATAAVGKDALDLTVEGCCSEGGEQHADLSCCVEDICTVQAFLC